MARCCKSRFSPFSWPPGCSCPPAFCARKSRRSKRPPAAAVWVSHGHVEGHLALKYSSDGAFSPDASLLAVASDEKVLHHEPAHRCRPKGSETALPGHPRLGDPLRQFHLPASTLPACQRGFPRQRANRRAPLRFWGSSGISREIDLDGKVNAVGSQGGIQSGALFPRRSATWCSIRKATFALWNPRTEQGAVCHHPRPDPDSQSLRFFSGRPLAAAGADSDHFGRRPQRGGTENPQVCG